MNVPAALLVAYPSGWTADNDRRWRAVFARILEVEGGHVDAAGDRGGETAFGISLRFLKACGEIDADHDGFADLDLNCDTVIDGYDVRALTPEIAERLYLKHFYIGPGFWNLPAPFDAALFDQAVNGGTTAAVKLLQRAINCYARGKLKVDGALGPLTRSKLTAILGFGCDVLVAYRMEAETRYRVIAARDPTQRRFLAGWVRRAQELGRV